MKEKTKEELIKFGKYAATIFGVALVSGMTYYLGSMHSYHVGFHDGFEKSYAAGEAQGYKTAYNMQAAQIAEAQANSPEGRCLAGFDSTGVILYEAIK